MKTAIVILILFLLTVAAFLILIAARWLGLVLDSHRRRALHCGRRGAVSIAKAQSSSDATNEGPMK